LEPGSVVLEFSASTFCQWERLSAEKKKDLFEETYGRELKIRWKKA